MVCHVPSSELQIDYSIVSNHGQLFKTFVVDVFSKFHRETGRSVVLRPFVTEINRNVTSFSSIPYCSNSEYWTQKLTTEGKTNESALDHIYISSSLNNSKTRKADESSTDNVPIIAEVMGETRERKQKKIMVLFTFYLRYGYINTVTT